MAAPEYTGERLTHDMLGDLTFARDCWEAERARYAAHGLKWPECLKRAFQSQQDERGGA